MSFPLRARASCIAAFIAALALRAAAVTRLPSADGQFWDIQDTSTWSQDSGGIATGGRANPFNGFGYLKMRTKLFLRQIGLTRRPIWIFHPGIDPNTFGYRSKFPSLDDAADDYVTAFAHPNLDGTVIHRAWIYLIFAVIGVFVLFRRNRSAALMAVGGVALAALLIQVGYFFGAMGTQFRFEHGPIVFCMITFAVLAKLAVARLRHRPAG